MYYRKCAAVFCALILTLAWGCAWASGSVSQFEETWINTVFLGKEQAWVLDRDGALLRWGYDEREPERVTTLPVPTPEMFHDYEEVYADLPLENQAQIDETVTDLAEDDGVCYALNRFAGHLGRVTESGLEWFSRFDPAPFRLPGGGDVSRNGVLVIDHHLYMLLVCWGEAPNRVVDIGLADGSLRVLPAPEGYRMTAYRDGQLLLLCVDDHDNAALKTLDLETGSLTELPLQVPGQEQLAYDAQADTIYLAGGSGIYTSQAGEPFALTMNSLTNFVYGPAIITAKGQYAVCNSGIHVAAIGADREDAAVLTLLVDTGDPSLAGRFTERHPEALIDWREDHSLTAADVGSMIRAGNDEVDLFSVRVDAAYATLVANGYAGAMDNAAILDSVSRMYPSLASCLKNAQGVIVAYPWDMDVHGAWSVNPALWKEFFGDAAYPATWKELFERMLAFESMENGNGELFLMFWDPAEILAQVLNAYAWSRGQRGLAVDYTAPELVETLEALEQVRAALLARGVETYDEGEIFWESESVGEHSIFAPTLAYSSHSAFLGMENTLAPFTFSSDEPPVYRGLMRVLLVNPLSKHQELAQAFIAMMTEPDTGITRWYMLHADATEPYDKKPWRFTEEDIARWREVVQATDFANANPLLMEDFTLQQQNLIATYLSGKLELSSFLGKLQDTARMVIAEME